MKDWWERVGDIRVSVRNWRGWDRLVSPCGRRTGFSEFQAVPLSKPDFLRYYLPSGKQVDVYLCALTTCGFFGDYAIGRCGFRVLKWIQDLFQRE